MEFYPADAPIPEETRTDRLLLRPLRATDVALDYDALMSSAEHLRRWSQSTWPADDFTLDQNRADLQRHEREHAGREAFTFTVLNPEATRCLGCVYLRSLWPEVAQLCAGATYAAGVRFWVRAAEVANDLDTHLLATLRGWFAAEWPFACVVFAVSHHEPHQAALMSEAGLKRAAFTLADGRAWWAFCRENGKQSPV
ncbi:MAG TPA: GNAT family protein [Roseiflexaceae bacterium]|jgi:hypothetical protein|nr:GNAT family protein [Roseiflexaceae bacterium]